MSYFKVVAGEEIELTQEEVEEFLSYVPPVYGPRLAHLEPDQFWFVVRVSGHEDDLTAWLDSLREDDPVAWAAASSKLQFAKFFERDHPFVESAREALGIPSEQLDALWVYGAAS